MSRRQREQWGEPRTHVTKEGATVVNQYEYTGYGFCHYTITGTREQVTAEVDRIKAAYPPQGYGGLYAWPPEKLPHLNPSHVREIEPGKWELKCSHSNSCE